MTRHMPGRHVLCPVDFSEGSRAALRYAAAFAQYIDAHLTVLTVNDPLLAEAAEAAGEGDWPALQAHRELRRFCTEALGHVEGIAFEVAVGRAAEEIRAFSVHLPASIIVIGAQGLTGLRKLFFGSTAERVLRDATVPVLITPTDPHAPKTAPELASSIHQLIVPVDLANGAAVQVRCAAALGAAFKAPLLLVHAIEPLSVPMRWHANLPNINSERRSHAEAAMEMLRSSACPSDVCVPGVAARSCSHSSAGSAPKGGCAAFTTELLVTVGEPAEEIVKVTAARGAGLIVMGLHASGSWRIGSVTYRVLSLARVPVLALPSDSAQKLVALLASAPVNSFLEV